MTPRLHSIAAAMALLIALTGGLILAETRNVHAAEVECIGRVDDRPNPYTEDFAKEAWPSGFRPTGDMCDTGYLHGTIVNGDYGKVAALYQANHKALRSFYLSSPGGDVEEALKIGRLFRRYLVRAEAPIDLIDHSLLIVPIKGSPYKLCEGNEQCECASACALMWFGAVNRSGTVGLHRPRTTDPRFKAMEPDAASAAYKRMLDAISRYLEEMEAPRSVIDAMVATSSSEIRWVDDRHEGLERPPSIAEWTDATCGAIAKNESEAFRELNLKMTRTPRLTTNEEMLYEFLLKKIQDRGQCVLRLHLSHVDRLPPPR